MQILPINETARNTINSLKDIKHQLTGIVSKFNDNQFNRLPFEGSWTGSQVVDHVRKSIKGIPSVLSGNSNMTDRIPNEKFELIHKVFLDFEARYKAPEFIIPAEAFQQVGESLDRINKAFDAILIKSTAIDLSLIYGDHEIPGMGRFTGLEWIEFVNCHTLRHINQLKKIHQSVTEMD
jgi:hypothetical protein